jgi:hemerythrin-like domain-containing protein
MKWMLSLVMLFASVYGFAELSLEEQHAKIRSDFASLTEALQGFPEKATALDESKTSLIFKFFNTSLSPHVQWEEKSFYPLADACIQCRRAPFTASFIREHQIINRWLAELLEISKQPDGSISDFTKLYYQIIGLLQAHLEVEDLILIPISNQCLAPN